MNRSKNRRHWQKTLFAMLAIVLVLPACAPADTQADAYIQSDTARVTPPESASEDLHALTDGTLAFAVELYQEIQAEEGNLFFSPHSITTALAMTYAGARGETASQMAETLHYTLPTERLHPAFNALDLQLQAASAKGDAGEFTMNIANSLWGEREYTFLDDFLDLLAANYGAGLQLTDFRNAPEAARKAINAWVEEQTREKIKDLIPAGLIKPDTRLVLANAIYFNADWRFPFPEAQTYDAPFTLRDGSQVTAEMMHWEDPEQVRYTKGNGYQAVELPYQGGRATMVLLVPDAETFSTFEADLTPAQLEEILNDMAGTKVKVALPKFSYEDATMLADTLAGMGMPAAMTPGEADFSGMDGTRNLYISEVVHKAFVAVDEEGTEAAAATAVIIAEMSAMLPDDFVNLIIDRPFIYLIRDPETGATLFMGRVLDPTL